MIDCADKTYLKGGVRYLLSRLWRRSKGMFAKKPHDDEIIRLGALKLKRRKARELLAVILTDDWRYVRSECTDIRKTFARNVGLPS